MVQKTKQNHPKPKLSSTNSCHRIAMGAPVTFTTRCPCKLLYWEVDFE